MQARFLLALFSLVAIPLACNGEDEKRPAQVVGRGSSACQAWQRAFCDLTSLECKQVSESVCIDTYYSITCNSDENAQACADQLAAASCNSGIPTGCNLLDLADPAPAVHACEVLLQAICDRVSTDCEQGTVEECLAELTSSLDCSTAIGYTRNFESCMAAVAQMSCDDAEMPDVCEDVIKTRPE